MPPLAAAKLHVALRPCFPNQSAISTRGLRLAGLRQKNQELEASVRRLQAENSAFQQEKERLEILQKIEKGEISAAEAVKLLRKDKGDVFKIKEKAKSNKTE